jgi:ubiquinol-cytochrome c reductase cytochrome c subunit
MIRMSHSSSNNPKASLSAAIVLLCVVTLPFATKAQPTGDAENGKRVFEKIGCSRCHGTAGEGMSATGKQAGPPKIAGTHLLLKDFVEFVRNPKGQMPPFSAKQVSDRELSDVHAFLHSVDVSRNVVLPSSATPENGQRLYVSFGCYECHGYQGQGSVQTGGSRIGPPQIPYSGFLAYIRQPAGQMPPYTSKAASDAQLADIYVFLKSRPEGSPSNAIPLLNQ